MAETTGRGASSPATPAGWEVRVRCFIACTLTFSSVLFFNGALGGDVAGTGESSAMQEARDWSCLAGVAAFLALMAMGMRAPRTLQSKALTRVSALLVIAGHAASCAGELQDVGWLTIFGACLTGIACAWTTLLLLLACSTLSLHEVCVCLAGASVLAVPIALGVGALCTGDAGITGGLWARAGGDTVSTLATLACALPAAQPFFKRLADAGNPADREVSHPGAFLPLDHRLFAFILAFSLAYGFAIRTVPLASRTTPYVFAAGALLAVTLWACRKHARPKADILFQLSFCLVTAGFTLSLVSDVCATAASAALVAGYMCFYLLMWFVLCAVAARSALDAIPAICWGSAVNYLGILAGALLGGVVGALPGDSLVPRLAVTVVLCTMATYMLHAFHSTSLDAAIEGIEPDPAPLEIRYIDRLAQRCEEVSEKAGLTPRESEILALLARGNNAQHIQDELSISHNTVKFHARNVYRKLGIHSQQELIDLLCEEKQRRPAAPTRAQSGEHA